MGEVCAFLASQKLKFHSKFNADIFKQCLFSYAQRYITCANHICFLS